MQKQPKLCYKRRRNMVIKYRKISLKQHITCKYNLNVFTFLKMLVHFLNIDFLEIFWLILRRAALKGRTLYPCLVCITIVVIQDISVEKLPPLSIRNWHTYKVYIPLSKERQLFVKREEEFSDACMWSHGPFSLQHVFDACMWLHVWNSQKLLKFSQKMLIL
jgi:hypothetical protein